MLRINQNSIFGEFLNIVKNTLALMLSIGTTHHLFVIVPKSASQNDSVASKSLSIYMNDGEAIRTIDRCQP